MNNGASIRRSFPETSLILVVTLCYKDPCISLGPDENSPDVYVRLGQVGSSVGDP